MEFFLLLKFLLKLLEECIKEPSSSRVFEKLAADDMEFLKNSLIVAYTESHRTKGDRCREPTPDDPDADKEASEVDIAKVKEFWGLSREDLEMFIDLTPQREMSDIDILKREFSKDPTQVHKALMQCYRWVLDRDRDREKFLIGAYVDDRHPLHIRRTLDQSYYYMLDNTRSRDKDQVVSRYGKLLNRKPVVMMVDQLWLWILEGYERLTMSNEG
jgi:hypothetical protein